MDTDRDETRLAANHFTRTATATLYGIVLTWPLA
jgi:hypothetical protein